VADSGISIGMIILLAYSLLVRDDGGQSAAEDRAS
jgi:hypothetical protein